MPTNSSRLWLSPKLLCGQGIKISEMFEESRDSFTEACVPEIQEARGLRASQREYLM